MKKFLVVVLVLLGISCSAQDLNLTIMSSLLDKSRELFDKAFWKSPSLYESFDKPGLVLEKTLSIYGFQFNNYDGEEGVYDEVGLRYLSKNSPRKDFTLTVSANLSNSFFYSFHDTQEFEMLKNDLEQIGAVFLDSKKDTLSVPGMDNVNLDSHYTFKDKTVTLTTSWFVMSGRSTGKPEYYLSMRYKR